jgi:hypothetical protein
MMRTTASLHRDDARRDALGERWNALRSHAPTLHHRARAIQPDEAAAVFSQIDPENRELHWYALSFRLPYSTYTAGEEGRAIP